MGFPQLTWIELQVMEAEKQKTESEAVHLKKAASFQVSENSVSLIDKSPRSTRLDSDSLTNSILIHFTFTFM